MTRVAVIEWQCGGPAVSVCVDPAFASPRKLSEKSRLSWNDRGPGVAKKDYDGFAMELHHPMGVDPSTICRGARLAQIQVQSRPNTLFFKACDAISSSRRMTSSSFRCGLGAFIIHMTNDSVRDITRWQ